jgi:hypothetical protein
MELLQFGKLKNLSKPVSKEDSFALLPVKHPAFANS